MTHTLTHHLKEGTLGLIECYGKPWLIKTLEDNATLLKGDDFILVIKQL